jgi:hypothetical protein
MRSKLALLAYVTFLLFSHSACAMSRGRVALDPVTRSTILDGDATVVIVGCDQTPAIGFAYCRMQEGQTSDQSLGFIVPPSKCHQQECSYIKIWDHSGKLIWGGAPPKGQTRIEVSWKTLLSGLNFEVNHRGFWTVNLTVYWLDKDGNERQSVAQGDIVLRVYRKGYLPLNRVSDDPHFVWDFNEGSCRYQMTSSLRTYLQCSK